MKQLLAALLCIFLPLTLTAQSVATPAATSVSAGSLTVEDVIKLSKAGVDDDVIIQKIKKQGQPFDLTTDQLIQLKSASVSSRVIQVMLDPTKDTAPTAAQKAGDSALQQAGKSSGQTQDTTHVSLTPPAQTFATDQTVPDQGAAQHLLGPVVPTQPANKPRVYLSSASKGRQWNAARDQSMEMSKDFEKDCPGVKITINQGVADYSVLLNHIEHGFVRDNQIQIANKDGDLISRTKEGGSIRGDVKKACEIILADWTKK